MKKSHLKSTGSIQPIAVFDSGIGSYSIVNTIKTIAPHQDIIYLADRKSFPYGNKSPDDLFNVVSNAIHYLERYNPSAIIIASNVPSITIMNRLKTVTKTPLFGIFPPVKEAMERSKTKNIGILGVQSLVNNLAILDYIREETDAPERVRVINASNLVEKVESGEFLFDKSATKAAVKGVMDKIIKAAPSIDTFTLSSTHLPWLLGYFTEQYPDYHFIDPARETIQRIPLNDHGTGKIVGLATEGDDPAHSKKNFDKMLAALNIRVPIDLVHIEMRSPDISIRSRL